MISNYVKEVIYRHQILHKLYFEQSTIQCLEDYINTGIYAFQLIYYPLTSPVASTPLSEDNSKLWIVDRINALDHLLCVHERGMHHKEVFVDGMWSYDAGQRYQWSEMETLIFSQSFIRNIKLENLL